MPTKYKLEYFPARYLAETARLMFHFAGQEFEDVHVTADEWLQRKPDTLYGTIPILTVDDKLVIGQSGSINRYLATKFNLAGKDEAEVATVDAVAEYFREFMTKSLPYILFDITKQEGDREQKMREYLETNIRMYGPTLVKLLDESKTDFFADSGITWVDFLVAEYVDSLNSHVPHYMKDFPALLEHSKKVHSQPKLQKYLAGRQATSW